MAEPESKPESPSPTTQEIHGSLARGIAWTGGAKWLTQILTWAATLVVAHILGPSAYGLVGMASVFLGLVTMLTEFGLGTAIVSLREMTEDQVAQLNTVAVLLGLAGTLLACLAAWPLGKFYGENEVAWIVVAMSANFVIAALRLVPYSLLQRELRFKVLAVVEGTQGIVFALSNMLFAVLGFGYWTLVLGALVSQVYVAGVTIAIRPHRFARPRRDALQGAMRFSGHILIGRLAWFCYNNADFVVAGKVLGKAALGAYSFAWQFANIPIDKITALVTRVTPAYFAAAQNDNATMRRLLLNVTEGLAFLTLPATVGLSLVAPEFVPLVLGPEWIPATVPLQLLCVYTCYRSIVTLLPQILNVKGDSRWTMWLGIWTALTLPAAFVVGSRWGPAGIAMVWIVVYPLVTIPLYRRTFQRIDQSFGEYFSVLWPSIRGTVIMAASVMGARLLVPPAWPLAVRFATLVASGAAVYIVTTVLPQRNRIRKIALMIRQPPAPRPA